LLLLLLLFTTAGVVFGFHFHQVYSAGGTKRPSVSLLKDRVDAAIRRPSEDDDEPPFAPSPLPTPESAEETSADTPVPAEILLMQTAHAEGGGGIEMAPLAIARV
jgi:hypothetical protein